LRLQIFADFIPRSLVNFFPFCTSGANISSKLNIPDADFSILLPNNQFFFLFAQTEREKVIKHLFIFNISGIQAEKVVFLIKIIIFILNIEVGGYWAGRGRS
jgi:hypothetical protein